MHYLSSVCFVNQSLLVSGIFVAHHQKEYFIYTTIGRLVVLCFSVDCLLACCNNNNNNNNNNNISCKSRDFTTKLFKPEMVAFNFLDAVASAMFLTSTKQLF